MIFVDTSFFAALLLPKDANHSRAARAIEDLGRVRLSDELLTTNNVILETILSWPRASGGLDASRGWPP